MRGLAFVLVIAGLASFATRATTADAPDHAIVGPGLQISGLESSEQLLAELNCVACHAPSQALAGRLLPKSAPRLAAVGSRVSASYLRTFLSSPHGAKAGTLMPDLLHGLSAREREQTVEDLVHFLAGLGSDKERTGVEADPYYIASGERLFHRVGCIACHEPQKEKQAAPRDPVLERLERQQGVKVRPDHVSVPLGKLAEKMSVEELTGFLLDPLAVRPSGRMPNFRLTEDEARSIAMYLLREQLTGGEKTEKRIAGVRYRYYEQGFDRVEPKDFRGKTPKLTGTSPDFSIAPRKRNENIAFQFTGLIDIREGGRYRFFTSSDDGSRLYIDGQLVVDNDGVHGNTEKGGEIELDVGQHAIMVTWFERSGEEVLDARYEGPGVRKQRIPTSVLSHVGMAMQPVGWKKLEIDAARAARGREHFAKLGCASCHTDLGESNTKLKTSLTALPLARLDPESVKGCLGDSPSSEVPAFRLSSAQRDSLRSSLTSIASLEKPLATKDALARHLATFSCYACHDRGGSGGVPRRRDPYFEPLVEADMGDEGRIPPTLDEVGNKLRPDWLRALLFHGAVSRPYVAARMPQFGESNVGAVVGLLGDADARDDAKPELVFQDNLAKTMDREGRLLVGTKGLSCITCHTYGSYASLGIPAVDLSKITRRISYDWFRRYLLVPQSLKPGTRMPEFWPAGEAVQNEILDGNTEMQIAAIWTFLSRGQSVRIPFGLKRVGQEIVASDDQPAIYRHWISGAGTRAIGVGYPEEINLAWDANDLRLALIWRGHFIDASKHRSGRGAGYQGPMGHDVESLIGGVSVAALGSAESPWPSFSARKNDAYRMRGYRLVGPRRRPVFMYSVGEVLVEDAPEPVEQLGASYFRRTLRFRGKGAGSLWFRAASDGSIVAEGEGSYRVGQKLRLSFELPRDAKPLLRTIEGKKELLVPVRVSDGEGEIVQIIRW